MFEQQISQWAQMSEKTKNWSCKISPPDYRDYPLTSIVEPIPEKDLPPRVSLKHSVKEIYSQQSCPWCVAFASCGILGAYYQKDFSKTYLYSRCKQEDGIPNQDGTYIRTALKIMNNEGVPLENDYPFLGDCNLLKDFTKSTVKYKIKSYARLNNLLEIKQALASGKLVIVGTVYTLINWQDGWLIEPEGAYLGGHATFLCGYDDELKFTEKGKQYVGFLEGVNSHSRNWGNEGFYWMAYHYTQYKFQDLGNMPALFEAWAVEVENQPQPRKPIFIEMWIDNPVARVNGIEVRLDQPPIINPDTNRALMPVRFAWERIGASVSWIQSEKKIEIRL